MQKLMIIGIAIMIYSSMAYGQDDKGICFEYNLSWEDLLAKANMQNKYIFVDCYATWCAPCKLMDKNIYSDDSLGQYMNNRFVCIKLQMDSSAKDNEEIRSWYDTAHGFASQYHIEVYPTYLFFSPDGHVVHKGLGYKGVKDFFAVAEAAIDPDHQYYTLLSNYRSGIIDYTLLPALANAAASLGQYKIVNEAARDFVYRGLDALPARQFWNHDNIFFVYKYWDAIKFDDRTFKSYYKNRKLIDSVMNQKGFAIALIDYVIYGQEIKPEVNKVLKESGMEPDWKGLEDTIRRSSDEYFARKSVIRGRVLYYHKRKDWNQYIKYLILQEEDNGIESHERHGVDVTALNNYAYEIFQYSNDKKRLRRALSWVDRALALSKEPDPQAMDTKANLEYKLGKNKEGIALEEKAYALSHDDKDIKGNLEKMRDGLPTW